MKVFLDVDGVFADFDTALEKLIGGFERHSNDFWKKLATVDNFFYTLEVLPDSLKLIDELANHDLEFLTALPIPTGKLSTADFDKRRWLRRHVSDSIKINTVIGGKNKVKYLVDHPGAVLIDDYPRNIDLWKEHGGIGILHNNVHDTLTECKERGLI